MKTYANFSDLLGCVIEDIDGLENYSEQITFTLTDGRIFTMYHDQDCCEDAKVEDFEVA